jgi:hypothetical protein
MFGKDGIIVAGSEVPASLASDVTSMLVVLKPYRMVVDAGYPDLDLKVTVLGLLVWATPVLCLLDTTASALRPGNGIKHFFSPPNRDRLFEFPGHLQRPQR